MKRISFKRFASLLATLLPLTAIGVQAEESQDTLFVYLANGHVDGYPMPYIHHIDTSSPYATTLILIDSQEVTYKRAEYDSLSYHGPKKPVFTSFKFNDKFNDQLTEDVEGVIEAHTITLDVAAIGKNLTPSFKTDTDKAHVYVDGTEQISKESRRRFADDVTYTVAVPGYQVFSRRTVSEAVWSDPEDAGWVNTPLEPDMLSTNMPSNHPDEEGLFTLLDGDPTTFFQSTWGTGAYTQKSEYAYIDIALPYSLKQFRIHLQGRDITSYNATEIEVYTKSKHSDWTLTKRLTAADGLPTGNGGQLYDSPAISCKKEVDFIRLRVTKAEHSKTQSDGFVLYYISWAELRIQEYHESQEEPHIITPAVYSYEMLPYGNDYKVHVHWLSDELTDVSRIDIWTDNGRMPDHNKSSKAADKKMWQGATFKLTGNGLYEDMEETILIKGRGNSSWAGTTGKSPYNIKFSEKQKPFGLTGGKNWVLLANRQTNSMLTNAIGHKAARLVDATAAHHIIPIDLYINDDYRGSYNFTEKVGISNNSVDIDENTGVLIELDSYFDETYRFNSAPLNQPINIKAPDLTEEPFVSEASAYFAEYRNDFNAFCKAIYDNSGYEYMMDVESFARFLMVNDLILNYEIDHPKSTYVFKEEVGNPDSKYYFGPIWDLDWGYGYEDAGSYYLSGAKSSIFAKTGGGWVGTNFFKPLLQNSDIVKKEYYRVWYNFAYNGGLEELLDYIQDYYDYAAPSLKKNASRWGDGSNYEATLPNARKWLTDRTNYIMEHIQAYDLDDPVSYRYGDVNGDGQLTAADVVALLNYILEIDDEDFDATRADMDRNGEITVNDLVLDIQTVMLAGAMATPLRQGAATTQFVLSDFDAVLGEESTTDIALTPLPDMEDSFSACEFTAILPEGITFVRASATPGYSVSTQPLDGRRTRLLIYAPDGSNLPMDDTLVQLTVRADEVCDDNRRLTLTQANIVTPEGDEQRIHTASTTFSLTTGLDNTLCSFSVRGGNVLTVYALEAMSLEIYSADGRRIMTLDVPAGTTETALPSGVYIVNGQKVIIK